MTIKTDHTSKPSGWDANFNPDGRTVEWSEATSVATETETEIETETEGVTENEATIESKKEEESEAA